MAVSQNLKLNVKIMSLQLSMRIKSFLKICSIVQCLHHFFDYFPQKTESIKTFSNMHVGAVLLEGERSE